MLDLNDATTDGDESVIVACTYTKFKGSSDWHRGGLRNEAMPTLLKIDSSDLAPENVKNLDFKLENNGFWTDSDKWPMVTALAKTTSHILFGAARLVGSSIQDQRNWIFKYSFTDQTFDVLSSINALEISGITGKTVIIHINTIGDVLWGISSDSETATPATYLWSLSTSNVMTSEKVFGSGYLVKAAINTQGTEGIFYIVGYSTDFQIDSVSTAQSFNDFKAAMITITDYGQTCAPSTLARDPQSWSATSVAGTTATNTNF